MNQKQCGGWDWAALILRIVIGVIFICHGYQKFFEYGLPGVAEKFAGMGIPMANISAAAAATTELLGGLLLVVGFNTRIAAVLLAFTMGVAIITAHSPSLDKPYLNLIGQGGFEYPLTLLAGCLALALNGGGGCSIDGKCGKSEGGVK